MPASPLLVTRIAIGKTAGFLVGLVGFVTIPLVLPEADIYLRWGVLLWYATLGAIIGVFGVVNWHPMLELPLPWWIRAPLLGAWMNFVLSFLIHDQLHRFTAVVFGADTANDSSFWFVGEGALAGLLIGYAATRIGSEGPEPLGR